ncbi:MAG: cupin domain-containing protein [Spirochaetes bacterium]|nr:cupin domain-containing protein [Spirochaetota bacterium]
MEIIVKKPTEEERAAILKMPQWGCGVSKFDWHYDSGETCLLTQGRVTVHYGDKSVSFGAGDYVTFPQGLSCVWDVTEPVNKHYII